MPDPFVSRRLTRSAFIGVLAWMGLLFVPLSVSGPMALGVHLLLLAPMVLVPLLLDAAASTRPSRFIVWASYGLAPAALAFASSFLFPVGRGAALLIVPWTGVTLLIALDALGRLHSLWAERRWDVAEVVLAAGFGLLPGGAVWAILSRAGIDPGPYGELVVLLTAVHFHYAAFVAPVWAGLLGRLVAEARPALRRGFTAFGLGVVLGTPLVAIGIAVSRGPAGGAAIETVGVVLLTLSAIGLGAVGLAMAPRVEDRWTGVMLAVSSGSLVVAMVLALWFNVGGRFGLASPDVVWMLPRHGWLNAIGFGLWGALGWRRLRPRAAVSPVPE
ncbi:MAG: YndJ family transporter [Bacteroidota bacterium]